MVVRLLITVAVSLFLALPARAVSLPKDPHGSPVWELMAQMFFENQPVQFDERVQVITPKHAEDSTRVPVSIKIQGVERVEEIFVFVDLNPIPGAARFFPIKANPYLSLRIKVNEATVIRAAARTSDGIWHVGGTYVDAAGGGCVAPRVVAAGADWADRLGEVQGMTWRQSDGSDRLRIRVMHPQDTGLVDNIPAFYIENLDVTSRTGELLARLEVYAPVSANPVFGMEIAPQFRDGSGYVLKGRDTDANEITAIAPPGVLR